jgi:hypothetical protein
MIDGGLHQDAAQMNLVMLSALHLVAEPWRSITPVTINSSFVNCGFSTVHVSSNDENAVDVTEDEKDDWHFTSWHAVYGIPNM